MKKIFCFLLLSFATALTLYCQPLRVLKVYSITEYIDGYVIKGIDEIKLDTISIVSVKDSVTNSNEYKKIKVGMSYKFEIVDIANNMSPFPPGRFIVRIKTTVVWKHGDGIKNVPVFSRNIKGLWIKE